MVVSVAKRASSRGYDRACPAGLQVLFLHREEVAGFLSLFKDHHVSDLL